MRTGYRENRKNKDPFAQEGDVFDNGAEKPLLLFADVGWSGVCVSLPLTSTAPTTYKLQTQQPN